MATRTLTPSQRDAVTYTGGDSVIVAGAGAGKTLVLTEKVAWIVEEQAIPLEQIAVVTFTEKAAGELKERLRRRLRNRSFPTASDFVGTIHSFAASIVRRHAAELGIDPEFEVMEASLANLEKGRIIREGFLSLVESDDPAALRVLEEYGFRRGLKILNELLDRDRARSEALMPLLSRLRGLYDTSKRERNLLDFQDLEEMAIRVLSIPGEPAGRLDSQGRQNRYRWIFVDEFQDTSPVQWQLITLLHEPPKNRLVLVGDPRQSIYRFRGADPHLFEKAVLRVQSSGGGGRLFYLNENFRSRPAVVQFVNRVCGPLFSSAYQPLVSTRTSKGKGVVPIELPSTATVQERREVEARAVVKKLGELREESIAWGEIALLFRTRRAIPIFEEAFQKAGIRYVTRVGESLLERPEVVALLLWFRSVANPEDRIARTALDYSPLKELPPLPLTGEGIETLFQKALSFFPEPRCQANLLEFQKLLLRLMRLGVKTIQGLVEGVERLRREEARVPVPPLPTNGGQQAVQLLTVHAAKGLEFPIVFLCDLRARSSGARTFLFDAGEVILKERETNAPGLKERLVKSDHFLTLEESVKEEEIEESKRLLYVALTRASEMLILPIEASMGPQKKKSKKNGKNWLDWIRNSMPQLSD